MAVIDLEGYRGRVLFRAGEVIKDPNGTHSYRATCTIFTTSLIRAEHFEPVGSSPALWAGDLVATWITAIVFDRIEATQ